MAQHLASTNLPESTTVAERHVVEPQGIPLLLRYEEGGARRPAVIMLHGWTGSKERFQKTLTLDERFVTAYVDLPGHGERPPMEEQPDGVRKLVGEAVQRMAGEVAAVVEFLCGRREVDGERIGLCGWSLGGFAALLALTERPAVQAAVAIAAPHSARLVHG